MKLSVEQSAGLTEVARYFDRIEEIAERMEVELDSLNEGFKSDSHAVYSNLKQHLPAIAAKRQQVLRHNEKGRYPEQTSIVNLAVIVNKDRF
jgi:hypothetical protein